LVLVSSSGLGFSFNFEVVHIISYSATAVAEISNEDNTIGDADGAAASDFTPSLLQKKTSISL